MKRAWIDETRKIIFFHRVEGALFFAKESDAFWEHIKLLTLQGYRLM